MPRVLLELYVVLAFCLCLRGTEANISFSTLGATSNTYNQFITALRGQLTREATKIYDIPVLKASVPNSERFILVHLSINPKFIGSASITVAIDVVTSHVVAYRAADRSYFLKDAPTEALDTLFNGTRRFILCFTSLYKDLEKAAGRPRAEIPLGLGQLNKAITNLWGHEDAASILVIIQMVSEATRFRTIEQRVRNSIRDKTLFRPDPAMLSLENNWSALSLEIQRIVNGVFSKTIELLSTNNNVVLVDSVRSSIIATIALLLKQCDVATSSRTLVALPSIIKMPVDVVMSKESEGAICTVRNRTTRIRGSYGWCVDVWLGLGLDENVVQLWPCGQQHNQEWTFQTDGTIRSMGKCMTAYHASPKSVIIDNCTTADPKATKWELSIDGTITHRQSKLVLTAPDIAQGIIIHPLTLKTNSHSPGQSWKAGDDLEPTVTFIIGYNDTCLTANNNNSRVWMEYCVPGGENQKQQWALYSDGTIRVNENRTLCVTSNGNRRLDVIIIDKCELERSNQRWVFKADGTILNPNAKLVMDVADNDIYQRRIILYPSHKEPNQLWLPFF